MATTNRVYVLAAFFFSTVGVVFNIVSLSTEQWVYAEAAWNDVNVSTTPNVINYGLFQGNYKRMPFSRIYQVTMTCSFKNNVCAMICGKDGAGRSDNLDNLYNNKINKNYSYDDCAYVTTRTYYLTAVYIPPVRAADDTNVAHNSFINAGVWLCTVIFLILGILLGLFAAILALYNTVTNPILYFLGVKSLFFYNGAASCCTLLYIILWGTMFNLTIFHNVGVYDTLANIVSSDKRAYLGYSYWISFISPVFYSSSIVILYYREYLNARDPKQQKVNLDADSADPNLYLY